jgi:ATP-dependent DNA helicase RecG
MSMLSLSTPIESLPMIGPTYAKRLKKLEIASLEDLLYHFPHRHEDSSTILPIAALRADMQATIKGTVVSATNVFTARGKKLQKAIIADKSDQIEVVWFNQPYLIATLNKAHQIQLSGKVSFFGSKLSMTSPSYEIIKEEGSDSTIHTGGLIPIYPETYGVSSKWLRSRINPLVKHLDQIVIDWLPQEIKKSQSLIDLPTAISFIHFPQNDQQLEQARKRLAFDELFLLQLASQKRKHLWQTKSLSHPLSIDQEKILDLISQLPFTLTKAQNRSIKEILSDLSQKTPMNRLLQGDVGSGKTVVAALGIYATHLNNLSSIFLAPTEILANQHFNTLKTILNPLGIKIKLVTGSTKTLKTSNKEGVADVYIGTHALLHREIPDNVGLLIVDEQHRFGVEQRALLLKGNKTPHLLSMTATPIPRTVALTAYGELDLSVIDEMPVGRINVKTWIVPSAKREAAYQWTENLIKKDKIQAFVVCPLIQESQSERFLEVKSVETEFENLLKVFPKLKLDLLHGRMKSAQKEQVITKFKQKKTDILVSTPVIEVGIDIPNANIMIIEAAERFGLAALHQLRGRIGRGDKQSYCLLFTSSNSSQDSKRLAALKNHHSGFALAEIDLELRGPGEMYGLRQHGFASLKIASFSDESLIKTTHQIAKKIIATDPNLLKFKSLDQKLEILFTKEVEPN